MNFVFFYVKVKCVIVGNIVFCKSYYEEFVVKIFFRKGNISFNGFIMLKFVYYLNS